MAAQTLIYRLLRKPQSHLAALRKHLCELQSRRDRAPFGNDSIDQANPIRFSGRYRFPAENQFLGTGRPYQSRQTLCSHQPPGKTPV